MELVKPEPLIIGGRPHYTLTSYDPVSIVVDVAYTTDEDVDYALQVTILQAGGGPAQLEDDAWIREHFQGVASIEELRAAVRDQLVAMNAQMAEEQKAAKCAEALAQRLAQRVPRSHVAQVRTSIERTFALSLRQEGLSEAEFLAQTGMRSDDLQMMFDQQAETSARHEAAIDAWTQNRKLSINDDELPRLLGAPPEASEQVLGELRTSGQLEQARSVALRNKAMEIVVAECNCNYHHESPAEAAARVAHMQFEQQAFMQRMSKPEPPEENARPHLKLV